MHSPKSNTTNGGDILDSQRPLIYKKNTATHTDTYETITRHNPKLQIQSPEDHSTSRGAGCVCRSGDILNELVQMLMEAQGVCRNRLLESRYVSRSQA